MQKVDALTRIVMGSVGELKVEKLTVLGGTGGTGSAGEPGGASTDLARRVIAANEQIKAAAGVDLLKAVQGRVEGKRPTI